MTNITQHRRAEPARDPIEDPVYDFETTGIAIADALIRAAEDQVTEAHNLFERTKVLADHIRSQVKDHSEQIEDMKQRLKTFGGHMLDAHRQFNGGGRETKAGED